MTQSDYIALGLALGVGLFVWSKREPTDRTGMTRPPENGNGKGDGAAVDPRIAEAIKFISDIENNPLVDPSIAAVTLDTAADRLAMAGGPAQAIQLLREAAERMKRRASGGGTDPEPAPRDLTTRYNDLMAKGTAYLNDAGPMDEQTITLMGTTGAELAAAFRFVDAANIASMASQVRSKKGVPTVAYPA